MSEINTPEVCQSERVTQSLPTTNITNNIQLIFRHIAQCNKCVTMYIYYYVRHVTAGFQRRLLKCAQTCPRTHVQQFGSSASNSTSFMSFLCVCVQRDNKQTETGHICTFSRVEVMNCSRVTAASSRQSPSAERGC